MLSQAFQTFLPWLTLFLLFGSAFSNFCIQNIILLFHMNLHKFYGHYWTQYLPLSLYDWHFMKPSYDFAKISAIFYDTFAIKWIFKRIERNHIYFLPVPSILCNSFSWLIPILTFWLSFPNLGSVSDTLPYLLFHTDLHNFLLVKLSHHEIHGNNAPLTLTIGMNLKALFFFLASSQVWALFTMLGCATRYWKTQRAEGLIRVVTTFLISKPLFCRFTRNFSCCAVIFLIF